MKTKLILDTDIIAIESADKVTLMVDLTAPVSENQTSRPARGVQICLDVPQGQACVALGHGETRSHP